VEDTKTQPLLPSNAGHCQSMPLEHAGILLHHSLRRLCLCGISSQGEGSLVAPRAMLFRASNEYGEYDKVWECSFHARGPPQNGASSDTWKLWQKQRRFSSFISPPGHLEHNGSNAFLLDIHLPVAFFISCVCLKPVRSYKTNACCVLAHVLEHGCGKSFAAIV